MADITLSAAVRQNLLTLQTTANFMSDVQNKLATGKKVNSALDNPNSFFTASGLNARANDLSTLLDDMGQSVQTLKAADQGITSITKLVESAKAKANQALQTQSQYERKQFAEQYNELLIQIEDVAKDSSYKGKNLLAGDGNDLTTIFNEDSTSKLKISAVDYTETSLSNGLNLSDLVEGEGGAAAMELRGGKTTITLTDGTTTLNTSSTLSDSNAFTAGHTLQFVNNAAGTTTALAAVGNTVTAGSTVQDLVDELNAVDGVRAEFDNSSGELNIYSDEDFYVATSTSLTATVTGFAVAATALATTSALLSNTASFAVGDTLTLTDGNGYELGSLEIEDDTTVDDLVNFVNDFQGVEADFTSASGSLNILSETDLSLESDNANFASDNFSTPSTGVSITALTDSGFATDNDINRVVDRLNTALSNLRSQASSFGTNLSTIEIRQDYTTTMINTLEEGAGKLTLADTNEEGANLLALQTRQQLASTSLSFASQADQTVLSLF
ncbi:flagellin [Roseibium aggregatum]|uniref:Flagellin n=1 Tax=Roseibium aggregatum TaxID=187304 RepID=A0A939EGN2_9HYPH|nr:flagellin [Roseibium aggregatum]MBN9671410.1 ABC transporter substrate-binding protein [Roseibium aggregatum]